jgi:hypothetical protein
MKTYALLAVASLTLSLPALAAEGEGGGMDMSKMGPWTRKPTQPAKTKKEVLAFLALEEALAQKGDFAGALKNIDFPVFMYTDGPNGVPEAAPWDEAAYTQAMKGFWDNRPKDMKVKNKPTITVLSDSLVTFVNDFTITMGKQKFSGQNHGVLVKVGGAWKWKVMGEAGWGGMGAEPAP